MAADFWDGNNINPIEWIVQKWLAQYIFEIYAPIQFY
jgi:hypothetical protein